MLEHIYTDKIYVGPKIKLLCTNEWVNAEEESGRNQPLGFNIDNIHQWSIGAGHNTTCPECCKIYLKRVQEKINLLNGCGNE